MPSIGYGSRGAVITSDNLGQLVRYYSNGWHVGTLAEFHKTKGKFIAVIKTPIDGQRKRRVPAEDCEVYEQVIGHHRRSHNGPCEPDCYYETRK